MKASVIGGGVIGAGWAARLLLNGHDVTVYDPHPDIARTVGEMLANARRAYAKFTLAPLPEGTLRFAASIAEAVAGAAFIQESAPERLDLKQRLLAEIDAHAAPDALICSSTSGLLPSELQRDMRHPGRFTVGHPFNPVYLLPLVEICPGAATDPTTVTRAMDFYAALGMKPLHVRKEIDGFIADRLLEALWREALWLVHDGVATTAEIDDAIRYGAGLRWAFMGTFLIYRLAGGEAGMRHFMAQFGPALKLPWTKLMDVPELTEALIDKVTEQSDAQAAGATHRALERKRDDCLVAVLQALKAQDFGAGTVLAVYEAKRPPKPRGVASPALHRMIDPEISAFIARTESFYPASTNAASPAENRATYNRMCAAFRAPRPPGIAVEDFAIGPIAARRYGTGPATLLYLHGGGYVVGDLDSHDDVCAELARDAAIAVVAIDYRLAPEHPYPAALDDAEAAFRHLTGPVIVGGDSAGGNLAAALCLRLKRLGTPQPIGQLMIYPGLGGDPFRNGARNLDAPLLPVRESGGYRALYAGGEDRIPADDPEFAPLCAPDLAGLAPAAIIAAGIDPLRQDAEDYAALLAANGVATLFRSEPGLVHGYLRARHTSRAAARSFAAIAEALRHMTDGSFPTRHAAAKLEP